jgi:hypothetical protein
MLSGRSRNNKCYGKRLMFARRNPRSAKWNRPGFDETNPAKRINSAQNSLPKRGEILSYCRKTSLTSR